MECNTHNEVQKLFGRYHEHGSEDQEEPGLSQKQGKTKNILHTDGVH